MQQAECHCTRVGGGQPGEGATDVLQRLLLCDQLPAPVDGCHDALHLEGTWEQQNFTPGIPKRGQAP